ncbi:DUF2726 domain-containing protein [Candidatus Nitronereus thalassa]|uniref:DUF2726 domain-containing protein n=1 Tax=Candidatus Nitronereus thalassa TaxID=3020898 RepID=A0ABU3KA66_9BACT|nr:DUF2726 domain-containing protein [Candidatus Nitronereus thalassa]MDT7043291.1 DUF2726 domain-containing protein [Candidatus Nitronereus thalassa]
MAASESLRALSIESLPLLSQVLMLGLTIVTFVLVYYLLQPWWSRRRETQGGNETTGPGAMTARARPLFSQSEMEFFNLLHLVSRDILLVFAKIPMRTLVQVNAEDEDARREFVKSIRALTADFVLVHPGTMRPNKIIMFGVENESGHLSSLTSLMKGLCQEAEIDFIRVEANKNYSAAELTELLGLREDD